MNECARDLSGAFSVGVLLLEKAFRRHSEAEFLKAAGSEWPQRSGRIGTMRDPVRRGERMERVDWRTVTNEQLPAFSPANTQFRSDCVICFGISSYRILLEVSISRAAAKVWALG